MKILILILVVLLSGCGTSYKITRMDGTKINEQDFARDEYTCTIQARNSAGGKPRDNSVLAQMSFDDTVNDLTRGCMQAKGWRYTKI
jgi:hypothetical protein